MRRAFTSHAVLLVNNVLRLPRKGVISRYLVTFITFMISALFHTIACPGMESCMFLVQIKFYCAIAGAIILEDSAIAAYQAFTTRVKIGKEAAGRLAYARVHGKAKHSKSVQLSERESTPSLHWRLVGFLWAGSFWTWSVSKLMYRLNAC